MNSTIRRQTYLRRNYSKQILPFAKRVFLPYDVEDLSSSIQHLTQGLVGTLISPSLAQDHESLIPGVIGMIFLARHVSTLYFKSMGIIRFTTGFLLLWGMQELYETLDINPSEHVDEVSEIMNELPEKFRIYKILYRHLFIRSFYLAQTYIFYSIAYVYAAKAVTFGCASLYSREYRQACVENWKKLGNSLRASNKGLNGIVMTCPFSEKRRVSLEVNLCAIATAYVSWRLAYSLIARCV